MGENSIHVTAKDLQRKWVMFSSVFSSFSALEKIKGKLPFNLMYSSFITVVLEEYFSKCFARNAGLWKLLQIHSKLHVGWNSHSHLIAAWHPSLLNPYSSDFYELGTFFLCARNTYFWVVISGGLWPCLYTAWEGLGHLTLDSTNLTDWIYINSYKSHSYKCLFVLITHLSCSPLEKNWKL